MLCGNAAYRVKLSGEGLSRYSKKCESVGSIKCPCYHYRSVSGPDSAYGLLCVCLCLYDNTVNSTEMTFGRDIFGSWFILAISRSSSLGQGHGSKFKGIGESVPSSSESETVKVENQIRQCEGKADLNWQLKVVGATSSGAFSSLI